MKARSPFGLGAQRSARQLGKLILAMEPSILAMFFPDADRAVEGGANQIQLTNQQQ